MVSLRRRLAGSMAIVAVMFWNDYDRPFFSATAAYPRRGSAMPYAPDRGIVGA